MGNYSIRRPNQEAINKKIISCQKIITIKLNKLPLSKLLPEAQIKNESFETNHINKTKSKLILSV
jgi:hypothetical protein